MNEQAKTETVYVRDPDGGIEAVQVTPLVAEIMEATHNLSDEDMAELNVVIEAMQAGRWHHTADEVRAWTPEQRKAAVDAVRAA